MTGTLLATVFSYTHFLLGLYFLSLLKSCDGATKTITLRDVFVESDSSGSFRIGTFNNSVPHHMPDPSSDPNRVAVHIAGIEETDNAGKRLTSTHSHEYGDSKGAFSFSKHVDDIYRDVFAPSAVELKANLPEFLVDRLSTSVFILGDDQLVSYNTNYKEKVLKGYVKIMVNISNWDWCNPCPVSLYGGALELTFELKSLVLQVLNESDDFVLIHLGGGAKLLLPKQVQVDGEWQVMPKNYPIITKADGVSILSVRVPKFSKSALYDMTIVPGRGAETTQDTPKTNNTAKENKDVQYKLGSSKSSSTYLHSPSFLVFLSTYYLGKYCS